MPKNRKYILWGLSLLMLSGLLWSRALLSISMGLWLIYICISRFNLSPKKLRSPVFIWSVLPIFLLLLGVYQDGFNKANNQHLLTALVFPVAALAALGFFPDLNKIIPKLWIYAALIGLGYPLGWFAFHTSEAIQQYGVGKSLPVFMDRDHLRFSIFLCSALLFTLLPSTEIRFKKIIFFVLLAGILLLAVRTAWIISFLIIAGYGIYRIGWIRIAATMLVLIGLLWIMPTANNKIRYTIYDWQQYHAKGYNANYSDGVRLTMNKIAWHSIQTEQQSNIGWSAIPATIRSNFSTALKGQTTTYGWPFNEWLFWWMGSGWWGMILFSIWLFYPAWYGWRKDNIFLIIWTVAIAASCLVECTLNYQFGAFLYVWPIMICWFTYSKSSTEDSVIAKVE